MAAKGSKQRRGEATRAQLIAATKQLLAEHDYDSVTLDQVAASVGVAKSSILWHFGSKEGLLTEAVFDLFEEIDAKISLVKRGLPTLEERIDYLLTTVGEYFEANPDAKGVVLTLIFSRQVPAEIRERIEVQWRQHIDEIQAFLSGDEGVVRHDAAAGIMALMHGTYAQWHLGGRSQDIRDMLLRQFRALHDGGGLLE